MKQKISNQMGDGHNVKGLVENLVMHQAVQTTLYEYMEGFPFAEILEVSDN